MPGITLGAGEGGNPNGDRPFIRGYNSESSMYVDGVRNSTSQNREMFRLSKLKLLKVLHLLWAVQVQLVVAST